MAVIQNQLRKNHKYLSCANEINQICNPLRLLNIHMFTYRKRYLDGSEIYLSNYANWVNDYFRLELYRSSIFEGDIKHYPSGFLVWPKHNDLAVFKHGQQYFNSHSGITYCNNNLNSCEFYFFSTSKHSGLIGEYFLANQDLLKKFIAFFKERTSTLLKECESHKVTPLSFHPHPVVDEYLQELPQQLIAKQTQDFHNAIDNNFVTELYKLRQIASLTQREIECLSVLLQKYTTIKVANALNISPRTVETHLANIMQKLNVTSKTELIIKITKLVNKDW